MYVCMYMCMYVCDMETTLSRQRYSETRRWIQCRPRRYVCMHVCVWLCICMYREYIESAEIQRDEEVDPVSGETVCMYACMCMGMYMYV
jgi:hypothetical protein